MKTIIEMAREAGLELARFTIIDGSNKLITFAALVAAAEREDCAKVCEKQDEEDTRFRYDYRRGALDCAAAIRARGNT